MECVVGLPRFYQNGGHPSATHSFGFSVEARPVLLCLGEGRMVSPVIICLDGGGLRVTRSLVMARGLHLARLFYH